MKTETIEWNNPMTTQAMDKWISVKERLPELSKEVWRHDKPLIVLGKDGCVYTAFYAKVAEDGIYAGGNEKPKWWVRQAFDVMDKKIIEVTHWMELPSPPKP